MIEVVKNGETVHTERVVVGEIGKQSSIFTRRLQDITFRPMWRVPESIKVNELWPSMLRGGGLMRQYGLEVETKDGRRLDWRTMDWRTLDIREYEVVQPPSRSSAMGVVKFSFPSQHTIFMHDTPDKWMFNSKQRTLSHGCLRLRNPLQVAELVLAHDKGWDAAKVSELAKSGPLNNQVMIEKRIPMHIAYFTAWVDDAGALKTYSDIYGHEKRVTQALDGNWTQIAKGRDHLAPSVPNKAHLEAKPVKEATSRRGKTANDDFMSSFFGGGY
jgi:murein L,D-transpeptidase YcbB/YkuD